jgi:hypothetical protein
MAVQVLSKKSIIQIDINLGCKILGNLSVFPRIRFLLGGVLSRGQTDVI